MDRERDVSRNRTRAKGKVTEVCTQVTIKNFHSIRSTESSSSMEYCLALKGWILIRRSWSKYTTEKKTRLKENEARGRDNIGFGYQSYTSREAWVSNVIPVSNASGLAQDKHRMELIQTLVSEWVSEYGV